MTDENENNNEGQVVKDNIVEAYKSIVAEHYKLPTYADFVKYDLGRDLIARQFGGMALLNEYMRETNSEFLEQYFSSVDSIFSETKTANRIHDKKRFIITTAVADSKAHLGFISAMRSYADKNDAQLIVMPCESITNSFEKQTATFDSIFNDKDFLFVNEDTRLNENLSLCSIQVSAKQIKPITGLTRIGNREGSYVFASPKQFLEYIPSGNNRGKNYSIMTTGACTLPEYYTETFVSKRLSYIAVHDHMLGAIIVELEDERLFHFRQIQADDDGSFIDLGVEYHANGDTNKVKVTAVLGDTHGVQADVEAIDNFTYAMRDMEVENVFLHDVFDGLSISHHIKDIGERQQIDFAGNSYLYDELVKTYDLINRIDTAIEPENLYIVKSNHDEFLSRYLNEGRYVFDPKNHYLSLRIAPALFEDADVLERAFEVVKEAKSPSHWVFLDRSSSVEISGVELASHGDLGLNGAKAGLAGLEKIYGNCVVGHNHTAAIQRGVFRTGTMSMLDMNYNRGPSSWTQTNCLVYGNGQRQLVNHIAGKYWL